MLPSTSVNSSVQGNGVLNSRDAARHTAGAKRYKYLRRLFRFRQMDFEFAAWQMLYLFTSPQRVYRNFHYRKQTKDQWARDDPAFLVLLSVWLCVSTIGFGFVLDMGFFETIKLLLWVVFIDCVGVGLLIATLMWEASGNLQSWRKAKEKQPPSSQGGRMEFISNKYLVKRQSRDYDVEWGYAFDVHLNAFYPLLVILHFIQLFFINHVILTDTFIGYLVGNTLWLVAVGYYIYVTFLGYSALPFLKNTVILLYPFAPLILLYGLSLALGWNFTHTLCSFYKYRVK
ncbi:protein unc-50 homolog isoform X1 [Macaca fascicularis]|uniref:protein unc-50 homolog isoform X1 n=1 Tax=Macaca fascicularis TaxID=9541 RepID=UPI0032B0489A